MRAGGLVFADNAPQARRPDPGQHQFANILGHFFSHATVGPVSHSDLPRPVEQALLLVIPAVTCRANPAGMHKPSLAQHEAKVKAGNSQGGAFQVHGCFLTRNPESQKFRIGNSIWSYQTGLNSFFPAFYFSGFRVKRNLGIRMP